MGLFELVGKGTPQEIQAAIDKGESSNARDKDSTTPLMYAAGYNQNPQVITTLLNAGADINARDGYNNMTPLMYAAWFNQNPEVITALVTAGANAKAKSGAGKTAFDFAQYNLKLIGTHVLKQLEEASR